MSDRQASWTTQQLALVCLIVVSFCGLFGFVIIYHYASYERPNQTFAIVVDAGSTQTRSGLFTIELDVARLRDWTNELESELVSHKQSSASAPLGELIHVQQVATCVNGGPLTAMQSQADADELAMKCLYKFAHHIKRLDFTSVDQEKVEKDEDEVNEKQAKSVSDAKADTDKLSEQMAFLNHRVNSRTHLYLGATAGMRALQQLNETRAAEKVQWIDRAFNGSNRLLSGGPFINKGFVGIIEGADEAAFAWVAVNFVCDKLQAKHRPPVAIAAEPIQALPVYSVDGHLEAPTTAQVSGEAERADHELQSHANSVATLELGGASAQMAYQAADWFNETQTEEAGLEEQDLELFNGRYRLATRSDLCMGMSQAVLRLNYVLLRDAHPNTLQNSSQLELENPCMQRGSQISLSSNEIAETFRKPCMMSSSQDADQVSFRESMANKTLVRLVGTADVDRCYQLLGNLMELAKCRSYFSLCPPNRVSQTPPPKVPFVTISGYNKALKVLNLTKQPVVKSSDAQSAGEPEVAQVIADTLGGYAINHTEFRWQTKQFCDIDVSEFPLKFPQLNKLFYAVNCMQLIYIDKLLTEFYLFHPTTTSWSQIKFLLFEPEKKQLQADKTDISWTLGLLLNATSEQLSNLQESTNSHVFFHHGSSVLFIMRATIFLMFACVLLALSFIVASLVIVQRRQSRNGLYEIHS